MIGAAAVLLVLMGFIIGFTGRVRFRLTGQSATGERWFLAEIGCYAGALAVVWWADDIIELLRYVRV